MKIEFNADVKPSWEPNAAPIQPSGFQASAKIQNDRKLDRSKILSQMAATIRKDPLLVQKLADRVYELLQDDLRITSERTGHLRK